MNNYTEEEHNFDLRFDYNEWVKELDEFELRYFEIRYIREEKPITMDYKSMDIWLFNLWRENNGA